MDREAFFVLFLEVVSCLARRTSLGLSGGSGKFTMSGRSLALEHREGDFCKF